MDLILLYVDSTELKEKKIIATMYPFKDIDIASRFVGLLPDHIMNRPCLRQLCPGDYRQPNYFAGPDGRGPCSAGRDF